MVDKIQRTTPPVSPAPSRELITESETATSTAREILKAGIGTGEFPQPNASFPYADSVTEKAQTVWKRTAFQYIRG